MTTPFTEMTNDENCQTIDKIVNNFLSQRSEKNLNALRLAGVSVSEFSAELANHLSTLNEGGSIALGRGENLASISLSKSLESLFSTSKPRVIEGPPLTWTRLVLFAGPRFEGSTPLKVEDSSVELSGDDLKLLRSELQSSETALQELTDVREMIGEVLGQISLVEQRLQNHHDLVSQLSGSRDHSTHQNGDCSTLDGAQLSVPNQGALGSAPFAEEESSIHQDSPSIPTPIYYASETRSAQPVHEDPNDRTLSEDAIAGDSTRCHDLRPATGARPESRLHTCDFIQGLSE
ncbi:hypothetical protein PENANT_c248G04367 [Penicillium antarcticum]|uniref:Uncharacterized protein n=1 Tax=Penicillium antarcticum TaxID=416450 RepID=A0A1V6P6D6_9EURO|nr:hypothetical protein PENANT_c248G04367 [Penicillium antarcticum]